MVWDGDGKHISGHAYGIKYRYERLKWCVANTAMTNDIMTLCSVHNTSRRLDYT